MTIKIQKDDLTSGLIAKLLNAHLLEMHKYSPAESIHALDMEKLKDSSITFWSAIDGENIAACGALKEISEGIGEIKSMKTADDYLRQGIAAKLLLEIITEAEKRSYKQISLETGSNPAFQPAIALYKRFGFEECGPFGDYNSDPYSKFYTKVLSEN